MSLGNDPRRVPDRGEPEPEDCRYCDRRTYNPKRVCSDCRHERGDRLVPDGGVESGPPPFVDPDVDVVECHFCGRTWNPTAVDGFDLSAEDEYYPKMVPVCPEHAGGCR